MSTSSNRPGASTTKQLGSTKNYQYPDTLGQEVAAGQHYMLLTSYESINSLRRSPSIKSSIALYIPAGGLTTTIGQTYEEIQGGELYAQSGLKAVQAWEGDEAGGKATAVGLTAMGGLTSKFIHGLKRNFLQTVGSGFIQAGLGLAVNNHLSVGYKGPTGFRDHTFAFKFFPKNSKDSENVRTIIRDFQNGATPRKTKEMSGGGMTASAFFQFPRHWEIKFMSGGSENKYLHKIKPSVITSMQTNYDPISMVSFHKDGSPVQIDLTLTFKELELITSDDEAVDPAGKIENAMAEQNELDRQAKEASARRINEIYGGATGSEPRY